MGIFSLFRRPNPQAICEVLAHDIASISLRYCRTIKEGDDQAAANAGKEYACLLIHMVDRQASNDLGLEGRDAVVDYIYPRVITRYCTDVLKDGTSTDVHARVCQQMADTLNQRQCVYARCKTLMGDKEGWPGVGTMVFALSFYIHRAMGYTSRAGDVDKVLCGEIPLTFDDHSEDFPDFEHQWMSLKLAPNMVSALSEMHLADAVKRLRGQGKKLAQDAA